MLDAQKYPTLALNADYSPLGLMGWQEAIGIVMRSKAYVVEAHDAVVRSQSLTLKIPSVIALRRYADANRSAPFTRKNIFDSYARLDAEGVHWKCALCGDIERRRDHLNFEHIVPSSKGGTSCYANVSIAHRSCNTRKGGRTLAQAGMTLHVQMRQPSERDIVMARIRTDELYRTPVLESAARRKRLTALAVDSSKRLTALAVDSSGGSVNHHLWITTSGSPSLLSRCLSTVRHKQPK